ncbi:MAG: fibronectin type III domain-containing protein [Actinobacteria bacterium]|nr:fibronectin type III domain-containing protein [Actinomycetota bacterium]
MPIITQAIRGDRQATVAWTKPSVRLEGLTTYVVKVFAETSPTTVAGSATVTDPTSTAVVTGLTNGQSYFATVTASTLLVINVESPRSAVFVPAGRPLAPTGVNAARSDTKVNVTWTTPSDNGSAITGYDVAVVNPTTGAELRVVSTIGSGTEIDGLTNGTQYAFKVRAINSQGTGPYSTTSGSVAPAGRPFPPGSVEATPGNGQATVTWTPPPTQTDGTPGDNGEAITSYVVTVSPGGQSATTAGATRGATFSGLDNGTLYVFMVTANSDQGGASDPSAGLTIPAAPPTTPTNVVASPRDGSALVDWSASSPPGVPVTYTVVASPGGKSTSTMSTSAVVSGLTNGQQYTFTVKATNSAGTSPVSSPSAGVTPQVSPPPAPDAGCETSPLPPPPGEVRFEPGGIRRRIDVLCQPGLGRVRIGFFITDEEVHQFPGVRVVARGDGRSFDSGMLPAQNRIYIEVDFSKGTGYVQVNRSCTDKTQSECVQANSLVNGFSSNPGPNGSVSVHFSIGDSVLAQNFLDNNGEISGDIDILPMPGGGVCVTGSASRYPSIEAYHDLPSGTSTIFRLGQSIFGPLALAAPDRGLPGC